MLDSRARNMIVQMENTQITAHHILTFEVLSNHELLAIDQSLNNVVLRV